MKRLFFNVVIKFNLKSIGNYTFLLLFASLFLTACRVNHFLEEDQYLIKKNSITYKSDYPIEDKRAVNLQLTKLFKQKKNTNFFFFFPREWFYLKTSSPGDTSSWDRFRRKYIGEPPSIFSDSLSELTTQAMELYLIYNGYFEAKVDYSKKLKRHRAKVEYKVNPGRLFLLDTLSYSSRDQRLDSILQELETSSLLKSGADLSLGMMDAEKKRILNYLRNNGYAHFYANYFDQLEIDTFQNKGKGNVYLSVLSPNEDSIHRVFHIGRIDVYPDFDLNADEVSMSDTLVGGVYFHWRNSIETLDPKVLLEAISIQSGQIYQQALVDKTNKHLSGLGIYKFARVKQIPDKIDPDVLNFRIELAANAKMEMGADLELTYSNRAASSLPGAPEGSVNLIGIQFTPSYLNRNFLGGAEILSSGLSFGTEFGLDSDKKLFTNTLDFDVHANLFLPKFIDYLGFWKGLNKIPLGKKRQVLGASFYESLKENGHTRISASYNYLLIKDWYLTNIIKASYGYDFARSVTERYSIDHIGVDFINPIITPEFQLKLDKPEFGFLKRSLGQQVFVSLLFRSIDYSYNSRTYRNGASSHLGLSFEIAGSEIWGVNALYNEFALKSDTFRLAKDIEFSQYVKIESDVRYYQKLGKHSQLAYRLLFGISRPFGFTTDVPYSKQFFAGGANGIRAWSPRGLGPGGYVDSLSLEPAFKSRLFQTGDLRFEFNMEWRFKLFYIFNGAFFFDVGNVWSIREDLNRVGAQFLFKPKYYPDTNEWSDAFYKQIAVGSGFGLRFDFSYFVFRLDAGVKLRSNKPLYRDENGAGFHYWQRFRETIRGKNRTYNISIGYPF